MVAFSSLVLLAVGALSALAIPFINNGTTGNATTTKISWGPCDVNEVNGTVPMDCGALAVPLDYTNRTSNATLALQLARVPASTQPARGSIQFNFGGPGEPGRTQLAALAALLQQLTGGEWDLVAFDPRGMVNTLAFTCYNTSLGAQTYLAAQVLSNSSDAAVGYLWARGAIDASDCAANLTETGELIGTAFTARDLMSVAEALNEDGLLRYWCLSYGTTLGATVASMFPDRIDKMMLDGVENPHEYYHALATTATELEAATWAMLERLQYEPIALDDLLIFYDTLKLLITQSLYAYNFWPALAELLSMLFSNMGSRSEVLELASSFTTILETSDPRKSAALSQALLGIHCGDRTARISSLYSFLPSVEKLYKTSKVIGEAEVAPMAACAQWQIEAKERYQGDFQVRTRNPVMFIGNTFDAYSPLKSAYNVSSGFEGSAVLEVNVPVRPWFFCAAVGLFVEDDDGVLE